MTVPTLTSGGSPAASACVATWPPRRNTGSTSTPYFLNSPTSFATQMCACVKARKDSRGGFSLSPGRAQETRVQAQKGIQRGKLMVIAPSPARLGESLVHEQALQRQLALHESLLDLIAVERAHGPLFCLSENVGVGIVPQHLALPRV